MNKEKKLILRREYKVNCIFLDHVSILERSNLLLNMLKVGLSGHSWNPCRGQGTILMLVLFVQKTWKEKLDLRPLSIGSP